MSAIYILIYDIINMMGILLSCFYIFSKAIRYSPAAADKVFAILWCAMLALITAVLPPWTSFFVLKSVYVVASILFILARTKLKGDLVISAFLLAFGIAYVLYFVASFAVGLALMPFAATSHQVGTVIDHNNLFSLLFYSLVSVLQLVLSFLLFRINRFKNGFPFLLQRSAIIISLIAAGVVLLLAAWIKIITTSEYAYSGYLYLTGILISGAGVYIWIRRGIRMFYRKRQEERGMEILERELAAAKEEIRRLTEQNDTLRVANHKTRHRLAALEQAVLAMSGGAMEASEELAVTLEDIRRVTQDYQTDIGQLTGKNTLPGTKIKALDDLCANFASQFRSAGIDFKLSINGSIPYMVQNILDQGQLETMVGDHLQNAMIAVKAGSNPFRGVWALLGLTGDSYAFTVYDSGISFTTDTLARLGAGRVTTHAANGGSGIGFMTTFAVMKQCNASLLISEKEPSTADYTKAVTIRFDGQGQYIIETYRPGKFPPSDRYQIVATNP
ncbi:MAG: hypothetical protein FWC60_07740 [Firmicutes bacterium]|nr:hypothetical protein [Bacillota bacterium]